MTLIDANGTESYRQGLIPGAIDLMTNDASLAEKAPRRAVHQPRRRGLLRACSTNQAYRPRRPPTTGVNDVNCYLPLGEARRSTELKWAFLPELAWGAGGEGEALLARLRARIEAVHCGWWSGMTRHPCVELDLRTWPDARRPPATAPGVA